MVVPAPALPVDVVVVPALLLDCTVIRNPDHDNSLRDHLGTHPQTWAQVLAHKEFATSHSGLAKLSTTGNNLVIAIFMYRRV